MSQDSSETRLAQLIHEGGEALNAGDLDRAEPLLREAHQLAPADTAAVYNFALLLYRRERFPEAIQILMAAAQRGTHASVLMLLAEVFEKLSRFEDAARCYRSVLKASPGNFDALIKGAAARKQAGDEAGATDYLRQAVEAHPNNPVAVEKYTDAIWSEDPFTAVKLREDLLASTTGDLPARINALRMLISNKEWAERMRHGQMPYHATSPDELFFTHAASDARDFATAWAELSAANPDNEHFRASLGFARFCLNDRHGAEALFRTIPHKFRGTVSENMRFAPEFYDSIRAYTKDDIMRGLPPLLELMPPVPDPRGVLYLSCNFLYFKAFALPLIMSLRERSPATPVHVHIMDADENETTFAQVMLKNVPPLRVALSVERPGMQHADLMTARCYYHAVRFIRLMRHMETYRVPLWLSDVDALANRDLSGMFTRLNGADLSMRVRPGRIEPWNQFNASVVGVGTTAAAADYIRTIAAYVAHFHQARTLRWGIDQLAMYGVYADLKDRGTPPALALLGDREVDYEYNDDGYIWCNSGTGKLQHLKRVADPGSAVGKPAPGRGKFYNVFERYWEETRTVAARIGLPI